jgi:ABC-type uncharacterized transport system substrate-binding protein
LAADLIDHKVEVIVVGSTPGISAAKQATSTIPIVFVGGGDLVAAGLLVSLARPGGNLTGISIMGDELPLKRFELLSELVPQAATVALLLNPDNASSERIMRDLQEVTHAKAVQLTVLKARVEDEINAAFVTIVQLQADALVVAPDPLFATRREQLVALASRHAVPAIYEWREFATSGGLISYWAEPSRHVASGWGLYG